MYLPKFNLMHIKNINFHYKTQSTSTSSKSIKYLCLDHLDLRYKIIIKYDLCKENGISIIENPSNNPKTWQHHKYTRKTHGQLKTYKIFWIEISILLDDSIYNTFSFWYFTMWLFILFSKYAFVSVCWNCVISGI